MHKTKHYLFLLFLWLVSTALHAQSIPEKPVPPRLVNDFTNTLSAQDISRLERKLVDYNDSTSTQILVVLVKDLSGTDPADYAFKLGEKWGAGQKGKNNGIVILVKPKVGNARGQAFIAVGYGLEGLIPDALSKRIVDREMIPSFKEGNYFAGLDKATDAIMGLASGAFTADQYDQQNDGAWIIPIIVIILIIFMIRASKSSNHIGGRGGNLPFWTAIWLASQAGRGSSSGSWGGFSGGSGGFGGGGGFGGFGGGSFGGGGAGGSW